jgi:hypothetical protein
MGFVLHRVWNRTKVAKRKLVQMSGVRHPWPRECRSPCGHTFRLLECDGIAVEFSLIKIADRTGDSTLEVPKEFFCV